MHCTRSSSNVATCHGMSNFVFIFTFGVVYHPKHLSWKYRQMNSLIGHPEPSLFRWLEDLIFYVSLFLKYFK